MVSESRLPGSARIDPNRMFVYGSLKHGRLLAKQELSASPRAFIPAETCPARTILLLTPAGETGPLQNPGRRRAVVEQGLLYVSGHKHQQSYVNSSIGCRIYCALIRLLKML